MVRLFPSVLTLTLFLLSCQSVQRFEPLSESWAIEQVKAPAENQQKAKVFRDAGFQLYKKKRDTEAIVQYEAALQLHASADLYYDYANSLSNIDGRLEDAIKAYRIGIRLSERPDVNLHYKLGCALVRANRIDEAVIELQQAYKLGKAPAIMEQDSDLANLRKDRNWREKIGITEAMRSWRLFPNAWGSGSSHTTFCSNHRQTAGRVIDFFEDNGETRVKKGTWTREGGKIVVHFNKETGRKGVGPTEDGPRGPYHLKFEPYERDIDETKVLDFPELSENMKESDGPCPE